MEIRSLPIFRDFRKNAALVKLAVPVFLELILSVMMGYVNQFMLSAVPLASNAIGQSNQILNIFVVSFSVLSTSSLILLSQILGQNKEKEAGQIYSLSFFVNLLIGLAVVGVSMSITPFVFYWMGVDENVIEYAVRYQFYVAPSLLFLALTNVFSSFLRANKKMVFPTVVALCTNIANAGIAAIFIWGIPGLSEMEKLLGVALATDVSRLLGLIASYLFFRFGVKGRLSVRILKPFPGKMLKKLLSIGLPTAGETLSYQASQLVLSVIINFSVPVLEQNLRTYLMTLTSLIYLFASGTGMAMQVVEGNLLGEGKKEEAYRLVGEVGRMSRFVSLLMSLILTALAYPVFYALMAPAVASPESNPLGTPLSAVALSAVFCMLIDIVLDQGRATNLVYVKGLETAGDIGFPVGCSIFTSWICTVGVSALLCIVCDLGIYGAFIGAAMDECVRALLFYFRWKKGGWRSKDLTKGLSEVDNPS